MAYKPGQKLYSAVSSAAVVVTRPAAGDVVLECGGAAMQDADAGRTAEPGEPALAMGKRYQDLQTNLEVLVVSGGVGPLTINGVELVMKAAKTLPSSD